MATKRGTTIGCVLLKSTRTQWKGEVDVLYRDDEMMVLCDWPNTKAPMYFLVAKQFSDQVWSRAQNFMRTVNTKGAQLSKLNEKICSDFDAVNSTFMTPEQKQQWYENFIAKK